MMMIMMMMMMILIFVRIIPLISYQYSQ